MKKRNRLEILLLTAIPTITAALLLSSAPAIRAQTYSLCPEGNLKFVMPPQLDGGSDVIDSHGILLADDFKCTQTGPITDIHIWASWQGDQPAPITNFWVGIYSDVPAGTNFTQGIITNSHPGNLLWSNYFNTTYCFTNLAMGSECVYNPSNSQVVGNDTVVWYFSFYPSNPFIQQGSPNNPTNYWLAVYAFVSNTNVFGWKTSISNYNDAAVWIPAGNNGKPRSGFNWTSITNLVCQTITPLVNLAFKLNTSATNTPQVCVETNGVKYVQWPNTNNTFPGGLDVWNSSVFPPNVTDGPWVLADDFICTNSGPISDVHLWGSWLGDQPATNSITFWLGLYDDVKASPTNIYSHPGNLLFQQYFTPGQYTEKPWGSGPEQFLDPGNNGFYGNIIGSDTVVWYYCFYPSNWTQSGSITNVRTYWLAAYAQLPATVTNVFGWKTTTNVQHDASVHELWTGFAPGNNNAWQTIQILSTPTILTQDLAFKITTLTNSTPCCPEGNGLKYVQYPSVGNGVDIDASYNFDPCSGTGYVLADDFPCTTTGPITDIHIWGSWANDQLDPNATFALGIWSDVPSNSVVPFSQPGVQLWTNIYNSSQYTYCLSNQVSEIFEDVIGFSPVSPGCSGPTFTANLYYYCFTCTNPFVQLGTAAAPTNYWLSVTVLSSNATNYFGWKTSATAYNDQAVVALSGPSFPQIAGAWNTISSQGPVPPPVNMAFKIVTSTNQCVTPPQLLCTNLTISCTNILQPLTPGVIDPCCPGGILPFVISVQTNNFCPLVVQYGWQYVNCNGQSAFCTNYVTVTNFTPIIVCTSNTVYCSNSIPLNPPAVIDPCCYNLFLLNTFTNSFGCGKTIYQVWEAADCFCTTNFAVCTQTVTVLPSPPLLQCVNLTLVCGVDNPTNPPAVIDSCCTNVNVTLVNSITNFFGCTNVISQTWRAVDPCCNLSNTCSRTVTLVPVPPQLLCTNITIVCGSPIPTNPPVISPCCSSVTVMQLASTTVTNGCGKTIYQVWQATDCCSNSVVCTQVVSVVAPLGGLIVVPNANATVEGNSGNSYPFNIGAGNMHYQQVYAASQFAAMPLGGAYITAIAFRADAGWGSFASTLPAVGISLSTTAKTPDGLDPTFANNIGADNKVVFNGPLSLSSAAVGSPAAFDIVIPLTTPFFYNPAAGNLLLNVTNGGGGVSIQFDAVSVLGDSVSREFGGATSVTGSSDSLGLVTEFIIGPPLQLVCSNLVINCSQPVPTNPPTYIDLCCTNVAVTLIGTITNGPVCSPTLLQNWLATDCCGNATNCVRVITVVPAPPTLLCSNLTVVCGDPSFTNPPPYVDTCCSNVLVTLFSSFGGGGLCSQSITQTWRALDLCCGTSNSCTRIVTVLPSMPTLLCTNVTISCLGPFPTNPPPYVDLCCTNVVVTLVSSNMTGTSCSNVVSQTWRAVDLCCNTTNLCTRTITVTGLPPTFVVCSNIVVRTCATNVLVTWPTNASSPCSSVTVTSSPPSGTLFPAPSTNTVTIRAWDTCGHTNTCTFTVTVTRPVLGILSVTYLNPNVTLHWSDGILQQSTNVAGPYLDVPLAVPPAYMTPATNTATFYRLRCLSP